MNTGIENLHTGGVETRFRMDALEALEDHSVQFFCVLLGAFFLLACVMVIMEPDDDFDDKKAI